MRRPHLIAAAAVSAVSTLFVVLGARAIGQQVAARGIVIEDYAPDRTGLCQELVSCLPDGTATNLARVIVLVAAFVPLLIGLILGAPLSRRGREEPAALGRALAVGALGTAAVAVAFRLTAARYTLVLDDPAAGLLREVHQNSIALMVTQTVFVIVLAAAFGLVVSAVAWPVGLVVAKVGGLLLVVPVVLLTSWSAALSEMFGTLTEDESAAFAAVVLAVAAALIARRAVGRRQHAGR
jgi:hypothetical protein